MLKWFKTLSLSILSLTVIVGTPPIAPKILVPVAMAQTFEERQQEGDRLFHLGLEQLERNELNEWRDSWNQALKIFQEIGDKEGEGDVFHNFGIIFMKAEIYDDFVEDYFQKALRIRRFLNNKETEIFTLTNLGMLYYKRGDYLNSEHHYQESLAIAREIENEEIESINIGKLAELHLAQENYLIAEQYFQQLLVIAQNNDNKKQEGGTLFNLAYIYRIIGQYKKAEEYLQTSLIIAKETNDKKSEATRYNILGVVYLSLGNYSESEEYLQQSLLLSREIDDKEEEGSALVSIGNLYLLLGDYPKAEEYLQQSLVISREIDDKKSEGAILDNLGSVYRSLGMYDKAEEFHQLSLTMARELNDKLWEGNTSSNLGLVYMDLGEMLKAEEYFNRSLLIAQEIEEPIGQGRAFNNLGLLYFSIGEHSLAEQYFQKSLAIAREIGNKLGEGATLNNIGAIYSSLKMYEDAEQYLFASIEVQEGLRLGLSDPQKISLFEQQKDTYQLLQPVLVFQNKTDTALEISERGRARAFVELLGERLADIQKTSLNLTPPNIEKIRLIAAAQNATIVQYSYIRDEVPIENFKFWMESELYIWVIKPTGEISFRRSDLKPLWQQENTGLNKVIADMRCFDDNNCRSGITVRNQDSGSNRNIVVTFDPSINSEQNYELQSPPNFQRLHQLLIEPIADLLPTEPTERVIFVPHDSLFLVPFPALQDANGKYLIEKHTILTVPSIQVLDLTREQKQSQTTPNPDILIVGNPTMPIVEEKQLSSLVGAEQEARDIGQLLNVTPLIGSQATKASVLQKMESSRIIHLATHGSFDPNIPLDSWLALTPSGTDNGLLTAAEIFELNLNAELVVLSACDTGRGKITGDGVVGLSRAFISAGVPTVLVSLWKVPDNSTSMLMREFYQVWEETDDKAHALRQAMLTTMQHYPAPEHWAAFTLIGESE